MRALSWSWYAALLDSVCIALIEDEHPCSPMAVALNDEVLCRPGLDVLLRIGRSIESASSEEELAASSIIGHF
jgi:hypothetical protein